mmetsp:Transcript_30579/g.71339  ORF Transcript_30579/g.71339 Transcript_30579/m.71339 type:complete len:274 (-) Transcript_30579:63-884(-)
MALRRPRQNVGLIAMGLILAGIACLAVYEYRSRNEAQQGDRAIPTTWNRDNKGDKDCGREGKLECRVDAEDQGARSGKFRRWRNNETVSVTEVLGGRFFRMERHTVNVGKTKQIDDWMWVEVPDMVNCLVQDDKGDFLLFRQNKYGMKGPSLAPIGGYLEQGEEGADGCRREVLEEMGMECPKQIPLGVYRTDANRGFGWYHAFHLKHCRKSDKHVPSDDWERQTLVRLTKKELVRELLDGNVKELKWANTFALAVLRESSEFGQGGGTGPGG